MAINRNFYPPVINTYMPAFPIIKDSMGKESATIRIYFALSPYNTFEQVSEYVQVIVRNQYTNQSLLNSINGIKVIDTLKIDTSISGSDKYYIELTQDDFISDTFEINQYMKAQIRFTKKGEATETKIEDIDIVKSLF